MPRNDDVEMSLKVVPEIRVAAGLMVYIKARSF